MFVIGSDIAAGAKVSFALNSQGSNLDNFDFGIFNTPRKSSGE